MSLAITRFFTPSAVLISSVFNLNSEDLFLSFLPLHHTFESTVGFLYPVSIGACIAFCDGIRHIAENLKEYHVSAMIAVPVLFEGMYRQMLKSIDKQGKTKKVEFGRRLSRFLLKFGIDIRRKIFKEILDNLGGRLKIFVAGGAAFNPEAEKGLNEFGVETYQGYGLTETSPVIAGEDEIHRKYGTVGFPMINNTVEIVNKDEKGIGEIRAKNIKQGIKRMHEQVIYDSKFYR